MSIEGGYSIATFCSPFDDDESVNVPELCFVPKVASHQERKSSKEEWEEHISTQRPTFTQTSQPIVLQLGETHIGHGYSALVGIDNRFLFELPAVC